MANDQKEEKEKLPDLPESTNDFWKDAEIVSVENTPVNPNCDHYFIIISGNQIQCKYCNWGLFVEGDDQVINGHLFSKGEKVV